MNDDELNKLWKRAKAYATKRGFESDAEDFAQEVIIKAFEVGPVRLEWMFANYRDYHRADKRILSSAQGQLSNFRTISLDAPIDSSNEDSAKLSDVIGSAGPDVGARIDLEKFREMFSGHSREIVESWLEQGTQKEVGEVLGLSASRVSQLQKRLKEVILILTIVPEGSKQWVVNNAIKSGKRSR